MERADWESRWDEGRTAFHRTEVNELVGRYADRVWGSEPLEQVLVPLCGKSIDMAFLAERARSVVGVEFVEQAVEEFFIERGLSPRVDPGRFNRHRAGPYTIYAADFFSITPDLTGRSDAALDRASLVTLDQEGRPRYVEHLHSLLCEGARTLLVTFDYDQSLMSGPPFAVSDEEVERLFSSGFELELLERRDVLGPQFRARGLTAMTESAFALTRK